MKDDVGTLSCHRLINPTFSHTNYVFTVNVKLIKARLNGMVHLAWRWQVTYSPILVHTDQDRSLRVTLLVLARVCQTSTIFPTFLSDYNTDYSTAPWLPPNSPVSAPLHVALPVFERETVCGKRLVLSQLRGLKRRSHNNRQPLWIDRTFLSINIFLLLQCSQKQSGPKKLLYFSHDSLNLLVQIPGGLL